MEKTLSTIKKIKSILFNKDAKTVSMFGLVSLFFYAAFQFVQFFLTSDINNISVYIYLFPIVILVMLLLIYSEAYKHIKSSQKHTIVIIIYSVLFSTVLLTVKPIYSSDLYSYVFRGRMIAHYNANPYLQVYDEFSEDIHYKELKTEYTNNTVLYGPLFLSGTALYSYISGDSLFLNYSIIKIVSLLLLFLSSWFVLKTTKSNKALFLFSWNPLIQFYLVLEAHNDIYMIFLFLVGMFFITKAKHQFKHALLGWIFVVLSALIKYFTLPLLPLIFLYLYRNKKINNVIEIMILVFVTLIIISVLYHPYWLGADTFSRIGEIATRDSLSVSPGILISAIFMYVFGLANPLYVSRLVNQLIFLFVYVLLFYKFFKTRSLSPRVLWRYIFIISVIFVATAFNWLMPWYGLLPLVFLMIYIGVGGKKVSKRFIYIISFFILFYESFAG